MDSFYNLGGGEAETDKYKMYLKGSLDSCGKLNTYDNT